MVFRAANTDGADANGDLRIEDLDPQTRCLPAGVPRSNYAVPYSGFHIVQAPGTVTILSEWNHLYRIIPLGQRAQHLPPAIRLYMGDSIGHWDGNTLVVDTTNLNDKTWLDMGGTFHSDALHVIERYTAIDADTKLMPSFLVGSRDAGCATEFMQDVAGRLANRVQLTTDGHKMYLSAVEDAFGGDVDYAQLVKMYGAVPEGPEVRYSPAVCIGCERHGITGSPDTEHVSTSYVERSNLTVRMSVRRFTRLTNAFSKKLRNHTAAFGLFSAHYNFCRIHQTLRCTPAMAAGVSKTVWSVTDLVGLLPAVEHVGGRPRKTI